MRLIGALVAIALFVSLVACGGTSASDDPATASNRSGRTVSSSGAEDEFLRLTAAHLCAVQGTVYDDPAALASAYDEAPDYPGLSEKQVADLAKRVQSDPDFSAALLEQVATTCGG